MTRFGTKKETLVDPSNRSWDRSVNRVAVGFNWMSEMNGKVIAIDWDERESDCKWLGWKGKWFHISKMKGKVITNEWEEWESDCTWVKLKGKWFNRRDERESDCNWLRWMGKWLHMSKMKGKVIARRCQAKKRGKFILSTKNETSYRSSISEIARWLSVMIVTMDAKANEAGRRCIRIERKPEAKKMGNCGSWTIWEEIIWLLFQ